MSPSFTIYKVMETTESYKVKSKRDDHRDYGEQSGSHQLLGSVGTADGESGTPQSSSKQEVVLFSWDVWEEGSCQLYPTSHQRSLLAVN